jgi:uncharacterized membrane protein
MTNQEFNKNISRLAIHFDPILAIFAPFYKIFNGLKVLIVGQAIILGLGAWAVFLIAEKILKRKGLALFFSLIYLLYFPIQRAVLFDFHAVVLATTFLLFAFYFNLIKKNGWYFLFIILSLLTKEHVGLVVFLLGIYLFFIKKERKTGLLTAVLGLVFFIATVYFIIPYFRNESHFALRYFGDFGGKPTEIIINIFRHPQVTLRHLFGTDVLGYIVIMMVPVFYSLFSPLTLFISLPEWAINILSINGNMRSYYFHYNSLIVPVIFYSLILGFKKFNDIFKNEIFKKIVFGIFIIVNIYFFYLYDPVPKPLVKEPVIYTDINSIKKNSIDKWVEVLDNDNISVSTTPKLAPFFTNRRYFYDFLFDPAYASMGYTDEDIISQKLGSYKAADYVIIDRSEIGNVNKNTLMVKFYKKLRDDDKFKMIFSDNRNGDSIEVYKKI